MIYLAYILIAIAVLQLLVALSNWIFRQRYDWRVKDPSGKVSILIPARNEEANIAHILDDARAQNHSNLDIIVYDDLSTDATAEIVRQHMKEDQRVRLVQGNALPAGWLGKNHACYQLAQEAEGAYFLFLDADVRLGHDAVQQSLAFAKRKNLSLLSVFPQQKMHSTAEWMGVPVMNYILLSLLPLPLVMLSSRPSLAAANGQFMLYSAESYKELQPHNHLKDRKVEDIESIRYFKQNNLRSACLTGQDNIACRMYQNRDEIVEGFSKNYTAYFGGSSFAAGIYTLLHSLALVPIVLGLGVQGLLMYLFLMLATRILTSMVSQQSIVKNLMYYPTQVFMMHAFLWRALHNQRKKDFQWKGRTVS